MKYKYNLVVNKYEEPFTGIFKNLEEAEKWHKKFGKWFEQQGRVLVLRKASIDSVDEEEPTDDPAFVIQ